jgi:hypothetical protein
MSTIIDGSAGITFPSGSNPQAAPSKVLQVVSATTSSPTTTSSSSPVTTGFSASITPLFSTSKIYVMVTSGAVYYSGSGGAPYLAMYRNSTYLNSGNPQTQTYTGSSIATPIAFNILDNPATTSSTTYTLYFWAASGSTTISNASTPTTITLMEIAA